MPLSGNGNKLSNKQSSMKVDSNFGLDGSEPILDFL